MRVLVTGASGFLGRAVAAAIVAAGHEVRCFQRRPSAVAGATDVLGSITEPADVAVTDEFAGHGGSYVFHPAIGLRTRAVADAGASVEVAQ